MTYSVKWLRLCEAEEAYRMRQYEFLQDEAQMTLDLQQALVTDNLEALRLLVTLKPSVEIITPLLSRILDLGIDSSSPERIVCVREVLANYKEDLGIRSHIQAVIPSYLDTDEWHYWRIAELYTHLGYQEELTAFLALCRVSENLEIQEISDVFASS